MSRASERPLSESRLRTKTALLFVLTLAFASALVALAERLRHERVHRIATEVSAAHGTAIQQILFRGLSATYALAALVRQGRGAVDDFEEVAGEMLPFYPGISALQLAPEGVLTRIVPLAGNEKAIGYNLLTDPGSASLVQRAITTRKLTLAGPFPLMQGGGLGVIGRLPVFLELPGGGQRFWGLTHALIRIDDLIRASTLHKLGGEGYRYALWHQDPDTGERIVFASSTPEALTRPHDFAFKVPNGSWTLSIEPKDGWIDYPRLAMEIVAALLGSLIVALFGYRLFRRPLLLRRMVDARTRELTALNAALHGSEERFRTLFEDTRQPIALLEDGRFVAVNAATLAMLHMERPEQLIGASPVDISPTCQPDGRPSADKAAEMIGTAFAEGAHEFEWEHLRADGEPMTARILLTAMRHGGNGRVHVIWNDITTQKQTERELALATATLRDTHDELQAIFEAASAGVVLLRRRVIVRCNRSLHQILGWPAGTLPGRTTLDWYADEASYLRVGQDSYTQLTRGLPYQCELLLHRRDRSTVWTRCTGSAIDPAAPAQGTVWVIEDISAERAAREALIQAKKAAEAANAAKSAFLANMSHELRTPMNAVMGFAAILQASELNPRQQDSLKKLLSASKQLLELLNDILNYVRIDTDALAIERQDFHIDDLLDTVLARVRGKAEARHLRLVVDRSADMPPGLAGDAVQLGQVLLKLMDNAVKFTESGEVRLTVEAIEHDGENALLKFEVSDTGIGIDADEQARLFEHFQQTDDSSSRRYGGTGLGLAIARRLVGLMGGTIGVSSARGQGSRFWFTARLGIAHGVRAARPPSRPALSPEAPAVPVDRARLGAVCAELLTLLANDDVAATGLFLRHADLLKAALRGAYPPLQEAIEHYDFPLARACLEEAMSGAGIQAGA